MALTYEKATFSDISTLAEVQKRCFDADSQRFLGRESGGPPGYDLPEWQLAMIHRATAYLKILEDGQIIGGIILFHIKKDHFELGRIYLDPACQDRGIGTQAMGYIEAAFPQAKRWTLDTPIWATRNHHFYEKLGYKRLREEGGFVFYEKRL